MYLLIALSVLLWAVLFGTGMALWWSVSKPVRPIRRDPRHSTRQRRGHVHA